jgi:hemerythrin superfamily protein
MDAITLLKDDHNTVEQLFKRFEQAGERAYVQKRQIVDRIIEELSVHAAVEEQLFYPAARAAVPDTDDLALESLEEHHVVKWLLSELESMDPAHERFDAKVTVLIENVRHHVEEEESEFFPKVRKELGRNDLAELGERLADAKASAPTRPHPRMPDTFPLNLIAGPVAGAVDRVRDNLSGIAQGGVTAVQDAIARITGSDRPKVSPTGSSTTRKRANEVRSDASKVADGARQTARSAKSGAKSTAKAAKSGAKGTATSAKKSTRATATTAKRAATTTARTARTATKRTAATAKRTAA